MRSGTRSAGRGAAALAATALLLGACGATADEAADADAARETLAPSPAPRVPVPPQAPVPPAEPEEPQPQRLLRTVPPSVWNPERPMSNASFQRFDSDRHREVGQTVRVVEPFELQQVALWFELATIALPGLRDFPEGTSWEVLRDYVRILPPMRELPLSLSLVLYRSPDVDGFPTVRQRTAGFGGVPERERDVIRVADLEVVTDQPLLGRISTIDEPSILTLEEPVVLEAGFWLFAFRIDPGPGDVDLLDLRIIGVESGDGIEMEVPADGRCDYTRTLDPYPDGAFYWRDGDRGERFIPAFAKVTACDRPGVFDVNLVNNPGDIALDLYGVPLD